MYSYFSVMLVFLGAADSDFMLELRNIELNCAGAAPTTRSSMVSRFAENWRGSEVEVVNAKVERFGTVKWTTLKEMPGPEVHCRGFSWSTRGHVSHIRTLLPRKYFDFNLRKTRCDTVDSLTAEDAERISRDKIGVHYQHHETADHNILKKCKRLIYRNPPEPHVTVTLAKDYQDKVVRYTVVLPEAALSDIRLGQKASFSGKMLGYDNGNAFVFTNQLRTETTVLRCEHGHEYAPSAGYKFCPIDGTKVN